MPMVGDGDGAGVGDTVGDVEGDTVGDTVGAGDGAKVGLVDGDGVGEGVGWEVTKERIQKSTEDRVRVGVPDLTMASSQVQVIVRVSPIL